MYICVKYKPTKNMKTSLSSLFFLLFGLSMFAQSGKTGQLESEFNQSSGLTKIAKGISIAEQCFAEAKYEKAEEFAEKAFLEAKKQGETEFQAVALNRKGKAIAKQEKKGFFGKDKATPLFKSSLELLERNKSHNYALMIDNLEELKKIYVKNDKQKSVAEIDDRIAQIKGGNIVKNTPVAADNSANVNAKKQLQSEVTNLQLQNQQLQQQNANVNSAQLKLLQESQSLSKNLAAKEAAIELMGEEQLKSELLLMQQNKIVDSLSTFNQINVMELANKESALKEEKANRNLLFAGAGIVLLIALALLFAFFRQRLFNKVLEEKNVAIKDEKERSENLLLNILPVLVANELKAKGFTEAKHYENVTVLFADFVNFSKISEKLSPQQLVAELDFCFKGFDEIMQKNGLEKIKTIGDAYMCAGGLPEPDANSATRVIAAAIAMRTFLEDWNVLRNAQNLPEFHARFGIHSGPVVAGVVGSKKFAFDIWGDTVNIASRMESGSDSDKINISGDTYLLIKKDYNCEYRGKIAAKNKGEIDMYFVR
jgi:adenylate cyclase